MATGQLHSLARHLRRLALSGDGPTDGQLLERLLTWREEAAFEALVRRHGPMVLGVCRRVLHDAHDAEDACQATFLVLARKAASIRRPGAVGSWLHGVAHRVALKAKAQAALRRRHEEQASVSLPMGMRMFKGSAYVADQGCRNVRSFELPNPNKPQPTWGKLETHYK